MSTWRKIKLGNILKVQGGFAFKSENYSAEGIPLVRISNVGKGKVEFDNIVCIPQNIFEISIDLSRRPP